jgi:hypothetical protein
MLALHGSRGNAVIIPVNRPEAAQGKKKKQIGINRTPKGISRGHNPGGQGEGKQ